MTNNVDYKKIGELSNAIHSLSMSFTELPATATDTRTEVENTIKALLRKIQKETQVEEE